MASRIRTGYPEKEEENNQSRKNISRVWIQPKVSFTKLHSWEKEQNYNLRLQTISATVIISAKLKKKRSYINFRIFFCGTLNM